MRCLQSCTGFWTNPAQREHVVQTGAWGDAFDEGVRWVAPIQVSSRLVTQDAEIRGVAVPKGETVMTIQASANHDEDIWSDGHLFDVTRAKKTASGFWQRPAFLSGQTHCAPHVGRYFIAPTFRAVSPNMSLPDPSLVRFRGFGFRGPVNLPATLT